MGYYTHYDLEILQGGDDNINYEKEIEEIAECENLFCDEWKWYEHDEHMEVISARHPKVLFLLHGMGEDGYMYRKYYYGGKLVETIDAQIVFREFDLNKIK